MTPQKPDDLTAKPTRPHMFTGRQYAMFVMGFCSGLLSGIAMDQTNTTFTLMNVHQIPLPAWLMGVSAGIMGALGMNQKQIDIKGVRK
jgi:hypothetical protein